MNMAFRMSRYLHAYAIREEIVQLLGMVIQMVTSSKILMHIFSIFFNIDADIEIIQW